MSIAINGQTYEHASISISVGGVPIPGTFTSIDFDSSSTGVIKARLRRRLIAMNGQIVFADDLLPVRGKRNPVRAAKQRLARIARRLDCADDAVFTHLRRRAVRLARRIDQMRCK